jgi:hypothetical protein
MSQRKLNLTDEERGQVTVTFNVNRFEAYCGQHQFLIGAYLTKDALKRDFAFNGIRNAQFDSIAQREYLAS